MLKTILQEYSSCLTNLGITKNDVVLGQLLLEAISVAAKRMGSDLSPVLLTILKPVLEKAGHPDFHHSGMAALESMAESLRLGSVSELLDQNADYFAPQVSFQLRNINRYPKAIDLLGALLLLSDIRMDHWLERMVQQALKGLDKCHTQRALPYVRVLELFCRAAHRARPAGPACAKPISRDESVIMEDQKRRLAEYEAFTKLSEQMDSDDDEEPPTEPIETDEAEWVEEPAPSQVLLVADVLDRCTQILPQSHDDQLYSSVMATIHLCIDVLWTHENLFLPKVHQLWEPLKNQLTSSSAVKQRQALGILLLFVFRCPEFVRHRVLNEAVPKLLTLLENQAASSRGRSGRAHVASQAYKLQKSILSELAHLVEYLDPSVDQVSRIVQVSCLYLSCRQLPELQVTHLSFIPI